MKKLLLMVVGSVISLFVLSATIVQGKFYLDQNRTYQVKEFSIKDLVAKRDIALVERLYSVRNNCIECHGKDLSGALVMNNGAMGTIYGANITPYNLSSWTDEEIARAIRYGIHKTGRSLRFMPSFDFEGLSIGDVAALVAYIRSVPPVEKSNHANSFGPVAKMLSFLGKMPVMFPAKVLDLNKGFNEKPPEAPNAEFGKYLANSCVGCHGPEFRGGIIPGGDPSWPPAANIRLGGSSTWTEQSFKNIILTGVSPTTKQPLRPPMPIVLLKQMNEMEIKAIWLYLSSLK